MNEIPPITQLVIGHGLHRLIYPCCSASTRASLPADVEVSYYGSRLSALVGLLAAQRGKRTPWASTVRTCQKLLKVTGALWSFLETHVIEPTNNAAERGLHQSVIQRKVSHGVQSRQGGLCRSPLLTATLRQQSRDVWQFLEQA